ncbi:carotenoid biosynthesis protein [Paenibacillus abyssi]|uniref:Carotenoid biosynthesis protein n=1 Tax=Paenibacillus abyssi TaxID=1340531 RepID=A0A917LGA6_9BACL|nr:carotenoid biosynthesis protein [Paenibacillus abyssi]GGG20749.1 hypothetical protein GCM10010916_41850 [Paenibacillus abyssi]
MNRELAYRIEKAPGQAGKIIRVVFWSWLAIGLVLMLFYQVPEWLHFSNGLFLVFYAAYAASLVWRMQWQSQASNTGRSSGLSIGFRLLLVGVITFVVEWIGTISGYPFGIYEYTDTLRFWQDGVPLAIGFAWIGVVGNAVLLSAARSRLGRALQVGALALAFDLILDPVAYAREFWIWNDPNVLGAYYGIPLQNFVSWFMLAALLSLLFPLRAPEEMLRLEAARLYQGMCLMFGLLAAKESLWGAFLIAITIGLLVEGRLRIDRGRQKQMV